MTHTRFTPAQPRWRFTLALMPAAGSFAAATSTPLELPTPP
ncbi:hypothetical protein [Pseudomonas sp. UBA2684]|nr:hypothetical protein [Pseudomonas sp. UBA2684]|tara:strand:- start:4947 stop:5069 length:123 start_codon:yes stop_codon:yes gene_type:complete